MGDVLRLSDVLGLPLDAVTETFAILGKRGSGKTSTAVVMVEEMVGAGLPVVVVDPIGVWWGLRSSADGLSDGLPGVIFGGDHGDVDLQETAGELIADVVIDQRCLVVLDLSLLSKSASRRFMTDFAERLYQRNRRALHLVLDEADLWAPQRTATEGARLLGAIQDVVRRGRARGIGCTLITQRPAVLNKDVLGQAEVLVTLRMTGPRDVAAIDEWVRLHADDVEALEVKGSLPSLSVGTAWVWSPGWLGILRRVAIRARRTFDSSATPRVGQRRVVPERMTPVDLESLGERIAALAEQVVEDDPVRLRAQIATLRRQLKARPATEPVTVEVPVEVPVLTDEDRAVIRDLSERLANLQSRVAPSRPAMTREPVMQAPAPLPVRADTNGHPQLSKASRTLLRVLVQHDRALTNRQLAVLSGYSVKSGNFANAISALRTAGLAVGGRDAISATEAERHAAEGAPPAPEGRALVEHWASHLDKAPRTLLYILVEHWPSALSADQLAELSGYSRTSGSFANALSRLRSTGLAHGGSDGVTASDELGQAVSA